MSPVDPLKYARVERERRYLLAGLPDMAADVEATQIHDRYVDDSRLRLRETSEADGTRTRKLGQKIRLGDGPEAVAHTSMYLDDRDWARLSRLPGNELTKTRRSIDLDGTPVAIDVHERTDPRARTTAGADADATLVIAEVDLGDADWASGGLTQQQWAELGVVREVTDDEAYTGARLAQRPTVDRLDPADLEITLATMAKAVDLTAESPDAQRLKWAAGTMAKKIRKTKRRAAQAPTQQHDQEILERTATGSPLRIDDETKGILLTEAAPGAIAGHLIEPRDCYICKEPYTQVDAFYHWLCPDCAAMSHTKRHQRADLTGKRALLTGGRAKIGMYIALMLLRDGADLTITTRFPKDAMRRFAQAEDASDWIHRLKIVGIDLRDPTQVIALADEVAAGGPLDILINNACQTVRRTPGAYSNLVLAESEPLPTHLALPEMVTFDRISEAHPAALTGTLRPTTAAHHEGQSPEDHAAELESRARSAAEMTALALTGGHASALAHRLGTAVDAGGLLPDTQRTNSWTQHVDEVDPLELLEVQLCNSTAPFLLVSRLRASMRAAIQGGARRAYVVNVSAMEGQFSRRYKGPGHPHTNMAKAALNMLTRTSAGEMFDTDQILMTAVDTGWITDERPHHEKLRIADEGWHAPLDLVDGAARVYDPIVQGERGVDLYGVFIKDYQPSPW